MSERAYVNGFVDGSEIVLLYCDPDGKLGAHRRAADWSSFHDPGLIDGNPELLRWLREASVVAGVTREHGRIKIRYRDPYERPKVVAWLREIHGIESYEGDVDPFRRYFSDTDATVQKPRRVFLDIETDSRVPPAIARRGKARVLCWSLVDEDENVVAAQVLRADSDEAEKQLLTALWDNLAPFDQVVAWFGDDFDFPIVRLRSTVLGVVHKTHERWLWMDFMVVYERTNRNAAESGDEKESLALDAVARIHLREGKTPFDAGHTWEEWEAGGARRLALLRYCVRDTVLLAKLEKKLGYLAINDAICQVARLFGETRSANPMEYVDAYLLRLYHQHGHLAPTKVYNEGPHEKFAGAFVLKPTDKGIVKDVHVLDFSGMYPSIIITWNLSPETQAADVPVNGPIPPNRSRAPNTRVGFRTDVEGLLPKFMKELRVLRKFWSEKQKAASPGSPEWLDAFRISTAFKVIANSAYGVVGSIFSRFFRRAVAESTSTTGVWLIHQTMHAAEERGLRPIYGDTDSSMLKGSVTRAQVGEFVAWCNSTLYPPLAREHGCTEYALEIAYEKEFERVVFLAKKNYCGVYRHYKWTASCTCDKTVDGETQPGAIDVRTMTCRDCGLVHAELPTPRGKPEIRGVAYKRGDTFKLQREMQLECINKLLVERSEEPTDFLPIIERFKRHVLEEPLPVEEVAIAKSIGNPLKDYENARKPKKDGTLTSEPVHVRIGRILKERGEMVGEGTKVSYVIVDATASPQEAIPALDYKGECDRHHLWAQVWSSSEDLLTAAFPDYDWSGYDKTRPKKTWDRAVKSGQTELAGVPRNPGSGRSRKAKLVDQVGLFAPLAPSVTAAASPDGPFVVEFEPSDDERADAQQRLRVKAALREHPGSRAVHLKIGTQYIELGLLVAVSPELVQAVEKAKRSA